MAKAPSGEKMKSSPKFALAAMMLIATLAPGCNSPSSPGSDPSRATDSQNTPSKPKGAIGVSLLTMSNPFFKVMGDAMQAEGKKGGYDVIITAGEMDAAKQKDQVNDFIVKKVSAIILSPVDSRSIGSSIQEANKAGIPVFTADIGCLDPAAKVVSHIATDNYGGGKLAGEAMVEAIGGKGTVAIITHPEVESVIQRAKGFKEVIAQHPGIKIVSELPWQRTARSLLQNGARHSRKTSGYQRDLRHQRSLGSRGDCSNREGRKERFDQSDRLRWRSGSETGDQIRQDVRRHRSVPGKNRRDDRPSHRQIHGGREIPRENSHSGRRVQEGGCGQRLVAEVVRSRPE